jgi:phenylalanyl-tRNA synthetase beta chain
MLISCNRLKSYIKDSKSIDWLHVWDNFTIRTAEIEDVKVVGNTFNGVVVAEIKECKEHPDSDHMHVLKVDCGEKDLVEVVCGAPNVRVGLKTAMVKVGGHIDGFEITARPLRGIVSNGMCCSVKELNIGDDHSGILELPEDAPVGKDIKEYLPIEDIIVEIDNKSLTNRPDLWGHYGIAREIAAITNHELLPLEVDEIPNDKKDLDVVIKDPKLCMRYCGVKVENIKNNKTPLDMQIFLYYVGMRSISLLVDLTNFLMLELGQPMHAFDARVVKNIEVGLAKDKDKYTTLDGVERTLDKDMLMIKNGDKYFGIAGVMGGLDSEILPDTTSTFLESATFNAGSIRKTAVRLGLRTESSSRYEKSLDPNMTDLALKRLVYLLRKENKDLVIASNLTDVYPTKVEEGHITLTKKKLKTYMGLDLDSKEAIGILESLGFKVKENKDAYEVVVPTYRHTKDVFIEEDLIEEIARIYGLENINPEPLKLELVANEKETIFNQEYEVKELLSKKYDMHEVHSYVWYDSELLKELNVNKNGVKVLGRTENNILRDDLCLALLNIVNLNFKNYKSFKIYEIGTTIVKNENKRVLSIILADDEHNLEKNYNLAKQLTKYVFKALKNKDISFDSNDSCEAYYDSGLNKDIVLDNEVIGTIRVFTKSITNKIAKKKSIVAIEVDFDKYVSVPVTKIIAKEVSKYPTVELDYTIIMANNKFDYLKTKINEFKSNYIQSWELVGIYENKYTVKFILGSNTKTLEQKELQQFKTRFIEHIKASGLNIVE